MRFHIPGIPHTVTNQSYISCAYTQKVYKLCSMLTKLGHEVYHYGCEGSNPTCTEHVEIVSEEFRKEFYPTNYHMEQFRFDTNDNYHITYYKNCIDEIKKRQGPKDFLLCAWGWGHEPIARHFDNTMLVVESGVGYESIFAKYRVFESYTWMAHVYGLNKIVNGNWYDCVIPNFFDPTDFTFSDQKEDWFLYLGRITQRKGVDVAVQACKEIGAKLVIAGQGTLVNLQEQINITDKHVEHVGFADLEKRKKLLSKAKGVFMPTYYIEPFGGVSIEAAMSGTPVISSDWGVFGENILHGITGYRCRTLEQFSWAAENIENIQAINCYNWGVSNFNMDKIALMYEEYFNMLYKLWGKGWYADHHGRTQLDWLNKDYTFPKFDTELEKTINSTIHKPKKSLAKIAFWTRTEWAFGRIADGVKNSLQGIYKLAVFDWENETMPEEFEPFDLIYIPTWVDRLTFLKMYPNIAREKVICGIHGVAELFYFDIQTETKKSVSVNDIDTFKVPETVIQYLREIPTIGVVNKRLLNLLKEKYGLRNLVLTECGVNVEKFKFPDEAYDVKKPIRILYPLRIPPDTSETHGYDVKRFHLVKKIQETIEQEFPDVEFLIPNNLIPYEDMSDYYLKADVHLCVSHAEGGPLVAIESAACGLIQISTNVGVVPNMMDDGVSGYLINEELDEKIIEQVVFCLRDLNKNKSNLSQLKKASRVSIENNWTWESKKDQWKILFDSALNKL